MSRIRERMRDPRVAAALAVVAVLSVGYRLLSVRRATVPPPQASEAPLPAQVPPQGSSAEAPARPPATPKPPSPAGGSGPAWAWDRNPFLATGTEGGPGNDAAGAAAEAGGGGAGAVPEERLPELRGTIVSGAAGMAIFGDRLVPEGEKIGEWTLVEVEPYKVSLRRGREKRVLEIYRQ